MTISSSESSAIFQVKYWLDFLKGQIRKIVITWGNVIETWQKAWHHIICKKIQRTKMYIYTTKTINAKFEDLDKNWLQRRQSPGIVRFLEFATRLAELNTVNECARSKLNLCYESCVNFFSKCWTATQWQTSVPKQLVNEPTTEWSWNTACARFQPSQKNTRALDWQSFQPVNSSAITQQRAACSSWIRHSLIGCPLSHRRPLIDE